MSKSYTEPIAVIGMGAIMPDALNKETYWDNILAGKSSITEVPPSHWDWRMYYDPDPKSPDKTYSKIGGFIKGFKFDSIKHRIPPQIALQMDTTQQLAIETSFMALADAGYDKKPFNRERTAVIIGNAMGGMKKEETDLRVYKAEYVKLLKQTPSFSALSPAAAGAMLAELDKQTELRFKPITEDTMPGELSNVIAGRVANVLNVNGTNFAVDAACATSLAAIDQAVNGLRVGNYDMAVCGGIDQMMSPSAYVKFSKIGALSAKGSFAFDVRADGFVMAEGAGMVILKRLSDSIKDGDRIYALVRAIGASSDGKGKGITAPNPKGQKFAIAKTFEQLDYSPADIGLLEAHGTATRVGDSTEVNTLNEFFAPYSAKPGSVALSSVKSQIGHAKAAAGIASFIKTAFALHNKILPPSINFETPNPEINWQDSPFRVVTKAEQWESKKPRRANISSFGFGGTNFHAALEEYDSKTTRTPEPRYMKETIPQQEQPQIKHKLAVPAAKLQPESFIFSGQTKADLLSRLKAFILELKAGDSYPLILLAQQLNAAKQEHYAVALSAETAEKLREKITFFIKTAQVEDVWERSSLHLKMKGIYPFHPKENKAKIGFMFPGQGSQYVDMMKDLACKYQVVQDTFDEADKILKGLINTTLTEVIWSLPGESPEQLAKREEAIKQTQMTQPAVLTADISMMRLLNSFGISPDIVMGHSLGEYAAAVASGIFTFENGIRSVAIRAQEMSNIKVPDTGKMASIAASCEKVEPELKKIKGYVVAANKNCPLQTVIAGDKKAIDEAIRLFTSLGVQAVEIPVSHAFHSEIIRDAVVPYRQFLNKIPFASPKIPILSNVTAELFPYDEKLVRDLVVKQITSPVEWIRQLEKMYEMGVRVFVECGPKRVLSAFATGTLQGHKDVLILSSNHPKKGGIMEFNDLLANLAAAGRTPQWDDKHPLKNTGVYSPAFAGWVAEASGTPLPAPKQPQHTEAAETRQAAPAADIKAKHTASPENPDCSKYGFNTNNIAVTGIAAGTPGSWEKVFRDGNIDDILQGRNFIEQLSKDEQQKQIDKDVVYVMKSASGNHSIERLNSIAQAIKLASKKGEFDLEKEFGLPQNWVASMDSSFKLSVAAGIMALKDAGLPLVLHYKKTSTGGYLPDKWALPPSMMDDTGVIFTSAFPVMESIIKEVADHFIHKMKSKSAGEIYRAYEMMLQKIADPEARRELAEWFAENFSKYHAKGESGAHTFSQNFLLKVIPIGHSQFCQWIKARGPATHLSGACSSTTQAVGIAEDWIRTGRAKRVIVIGADDITNETVLEWVMAGFLASGAATTKSEIAEAALPFDKRRHGMIVGMGAVGMVIEDETEAAKRGMKPLARLLGTAIANSAFHPTRLDVTHVASVMDALLSKVEKRHGLDRKEMTAKMLFMSHETYTPARGGSASAEVNALKTTFGEHVKNVVVSNVKGFTGHTMGASLEDVVAIRALNTGTVPPIANYKEPDPELAGITLSSGGTYDLKYALRLGAGFGSQLAMSIVERMYKAGEPRVENEALHREWLKTISGQETPELEVCNNTLRVKDTDEVRKGGVPPITIEAPKAFVTAEMQAAHAAVAAHPKTEAPKPQPAPAAAAVAAAERPAQAAVHTRKPAASKDTVKSEILDMISKKTGYPQDMLELDLDMEADLGIDTVKQAELFAAIRDHYQIPRREGLKLKDYPTIRHCINFAISESGTEKPAQEPHAAHPQTTPVVEPPAAKHVTTPKPAAAKPAATAPAKTIDENAVKSAILDMISQKTGYPQDMLELDLDMEADLGIDTVKQAELFAAIRDHYQIPRREGLKLKDYPTIRHCINFVISESGAKKPAQEEQPAVKQPEHVEINPAPAKQAAAKPVSMNEEAVKATILEMISQKTGYPQDMLELDLDMEADLGIDTVKQAELFAAIRDHYQIPRREGLKLKDYPTIRHCINFVISESGTEKPAQEPHAAHPQTTPVVEPPAAKHVTTPKPAAAKPAATAPAKTIDENAVKSAILDMISQKTGYPQDMLELDLDMEADLGIDTVKQAELFAAIRDHYQIPRREGLKLKDYPTIRHCINFVISESGADNPAQEQPAVKQPEHVEINPAPAKQAAAKPVMTTKPAAAKPVTPAVPVTVFNEDAVKTTILDMISQKTGYPQDMLELDLDMEADLGIDTVKQAELFAAIRDHYKIARQEGLKLKDYPTIRHCIRFVVESSSQPQAERQETPVPAKTPKKSAAAIYAEPASNIRLLPSVVEAPLAQQPTLQLSTRRPVLIFSDNAALTRAFQYELAQLKVPIHIFTSLKTRSKNTTIVDWGNLQEVEQAIKLYAAENTNPQGIVYLLGAFNKRLDKTVNPHDDLSKYVMPLFLSCKIFEKNLANRTDSATFISVNMQLDGAFGYKTKKDFDPLCGALAGTAQCLRKDMHELTKARTKLLDFPPEESAEIVARESLDEILKGDDRLAVAFNAGKRYTYYAVPSKLNKAHEYYNLRGKTFIITGGGRGLGAMFAKMAAEQYQPKVIIFDVIKLDDNTPQWAQLDEAGLKALKASLWETLKADTTRKATPVILEREYAKVTDSVQLHNNLQAIRELGSEVEYYACDVTDSQTLTSTLSDIKAKHGKIDGVVHFAGLERSKLVNEKTVEEFFKVFDVKATSAMALLASDVVKETGFWVFISSIAGKFGNLGQSDYAAASDYISKLALSLSNKGVRAIAADMSGYASIGMAARPGVEAFLKSQGMEFIQPQEGMATILDEIVYGRVPEIVLTSHLRKLDWDKQVRLEDNKDAPKPEPEQGGGADPAYHFVETVTALEKNVSLKAEKEFSLEKDPYLKDHSIGGVPYVPGVMGLETFIEAAAVLTGQAPTGLEDVHFALPIKLLRGKPQKVRINAVKEANGINLDIESDFINPQGVKMGNPRRHFSARIFGGYESLWNSHRKPKALALAEPKLTKEDIYKEFFHGPSFQVLDSILDIGQNSVLASYKKPEQSPWYDNEPNKLLGHPLVIEAAFQACGFRDLHIEKRMTLPDSIGRVIIHNPAEAPAQLYVLAVFKDKDLEGKSVYDAFAFDAKGKIWVELQDYYMIGQ